MVKVRTYCAMQTTREQKMVHVSFQYFPLSQLTKQSRTSPSQHLNLSSSMSGDQAQVDHITFYANVDSFFHEGVILLPDDYFHSHNSHCGICLEADSATDDPDTNVSSYIEHSTETPNVATTVQINSCSHVFHKNGLHAWIAYTRSPLRGATCPLCRTDIVERIYDPGYTVAIIGLMDLLDRIAFATTGAERYEAERAYLVADNVVIERSGYASDSHLEASVLMRMNIEAYEEQKEQRCAGGRLRRQWDRLSASLRSVFCE
jgi:hypothetical protein